MKSLQKKLANAIGKAQVFTDDLTLVATSADAGCYQKIPRIVLKPTCEKEVVDALRILHQTGTPVTFRAAGTSLSGQSISDSVLLQARGDHWNDCEVLDQGRAIRARPGITGTRLNQVLAPYGMKFGPDPASINSAMLGGIVANNASGMSCGIHANSYATIRSARIIFADGTLLDTGDRESRESFARERPQLIAALVGMQEKIRSDPRLVERIREKYTIKNTTGYGLNSFLDFDDPMDLILHLMVGSEGTLGFVSEATFSTVPVKAHRASALLYFQDLVSACNAVPLLRQARIPAIEIMDRKALRSVEGNPGIPQYLRDFPDQVTALLIDLEAESQEGLDEQIAETEKALSGFALVRDFEVTRDARRIAAYWNVRKGVFPSVGGTREPGTSVIIEDVAVHPDRLTEAVTDMRSMLDEMGYQEAVIYGHVLDGNLHFIFSQDFQDPRELEKYEKMIHRLTRLVVDQYNGSLKAEHGTGLNMAPFVAYEWGEALYGIMKGIKSAFDPEGILNPEVIISEDPRLHLKHLKPMPEVDPTVDKCIECGFCEINCLTTGYTLTARQRIVVQREVMRLGTSGAAQGRIRNLVKGFRYQGNDSCAVDGLCARSCPLSIDTGALVRELRTRNNAGKRPGNPVAAGIARHLPAVHWFVETGLGLMAGIGGILPVRRIFIWDRHMPRPVKRMPLAAPSREEGRLKVVYFPSCINQSMGTAVRDPEKRSLAAVTVEVLERAGYTVVFPDGMRSRCCGTPWESKGFSRIADAMSRTLELALLRASDGGRIPVLCDTSPCTHRMKRVMEGPLQLYEPVEFIHDHLLEKLELEPVRERMAFHVTCSSMKMELREKFERVARACTTSPLFPEEVGCCGFAGDKGFSDPALNRWALRNLAREVKGFSGGYSNSRTCEIGLSRNSGIDYKSIMYLVHRAMVKDR